jgi:eukaryotic-like serine/threonine-protein kinase
MGQALPSLDPVFEQGSVLCRRYRIDAAIASGGMGTVFRATHLALGHDVAIKVLHERALCDDALRRFAREAKIAAHLSELCSNVVRVIDYGVESGRPFLVMELLRGEDLRMRLDHERRLPPIVALDIAAQLADALDVLHEEGIVHRDLKPANVFLARGRNDTVVKLMDFGVAQTGEGTLRKGFVLGTPAFMAPEQIEGRPIDHRADLWALGIVVYRMLTGFLPFGVGSIKEIGTSIIDGEPEPPSSLVASLPRALDAWMDRALAKEPDDRFMTAGEMIADLRVALGLPTSGYPALTRNSSGMRSIGAPPSSWVLVLATLLAATLATVLLLIR